MSDSWRSVRIYFCTGYSDMIGERRAINERVVSELRHMCVALRLRIVDVDLRPGLSAHQLRSLGPKSIGPILAEIQRCLPFFVAVVGHQYGAELQHYHVPSDPEFMWVQSYPEGRSLLELEIFAGALRDAQRSIGCIFLRSDSSIESPDFKAAVDLYCNADGLSKFPTEKTDLKIGATFLSPTPSASKKMRNLRAALQSVFPDCYTYNACWGGQVNGEPVMTDLNEMCVLMLKQLWGALQLRFPASNLSSDASMLQDRYHECVFQDHTRHAIIGRDAIIRDIFEAIDRPANLVVLQGATGVGLSSIASHVHKRFISQIPAGKFVSALHFVGGCPFSADSRAIMNRLTSFFIKHFDMDRQLPLDYSELVRAFHSTLAHAASVAGPRIQIVVIIDALHMINSSHFGHMLQWLPEGLPPTVHVLLTVVSDSEQGQLLSRRLPKQQIIDVPPLSRAGASELISTILHDMNRALSVAQMQAILNKADGLKPAFLSLSCQLVHDYGKFDRVFSLNERLDGFVENIPQDLRMLGTTLVERFDDEFPKQEYGDIIEKVFCFSATSRDGLTDVEMIDLLGSMDAAAVQPASRMIWARIFMSLEPFIMPAPPNQDRYLLFKHYCLVLAVQRMYFSDSPRSLDLWVKVYSFVQARLRAEEKDSLDVASDALKNVTARNLEERYHSKLAKYFQLRERGDARTSWTGMYPRALLQLPHHLMTARMWDKLVDTLTDLRFVEGKFRLGMGHDIISDLIEALASAAPKSKSSSSEKSAKLSSNHRKVIAMYQFVSQNFQALLAEPRLVFQYAANQADGSILHGLACKFWENGSMVQAWVQWLNKSSATEPCMSVMVKHSSPVTCVDFTSDGVGLYSVSDDGLLCSWDAYGGNLILFFAVHVLSTYGVASLPGSARSHVRGRLASLDTRVITCSRDKSGKVWDARGQVCERTLTGPEGRVLSCCYCSELRLIVLTSWDKNAYVYRLDDGTLLKRLVGHKNAVMNAQFDPDGSILATVSDDESCMLWDTGSWEVLATVEGHDNSVTCVSFSGDSTFFATSSYDKTLRLWSVADCLNPDFDVGAFFDDSAMEWRRRRLELCICVGHTDRVMSCSVSPNGKFLASGSKDAVVMIWNAVISPDMAALRSKGLEVAIAPLFRLEGHTGGINCVKFAVDSIRVASGSDDCSIRLWDFSGGSTPAPSGHSDIVSGVTAVPRGECACSVSINGQLKYWDCRTGLELAMLVSNESAAFLCCSIITDGSRVMVGGVDGVVRVYSTSNGMQVATQRHSLKPVLAVDVSPLGVNGVSCSGDGSVKVWELETMMLKGLFAAHSANCNCVSYDSTAAFIATGGDDGLVRLWERGISAARSIIVPSASGHPDEASTIVQQPQIWTMVRELRGHVGAVHAVVFSRDGNNIISGGVDGCMRVWDVPRQTCTLALNLRSGPLNSIATSRDGNIIATCTEATTGDQKGASIQIWSAHAFSRLASLATKGPAKCVCVAGDSPYMVGAGDSLGNVYWTSYGCIPPSPIPPKQQGEQELRPSATCTML